MITHDNLWKAITYNNLKPVKTCNYLQPRTSSTWKPLSTTNNFWFAFCRQKTTGREDTEVEQSPSSPPSSLKPQEPKVSQLLEWRTIGDNEAEVLVLWTNSNSAEWVRGSTLALSDAISQSDLQSFMDTHAMKYLPLPGKSREAEVPSPGSKPSEPEPGSRMEVDLAEHAKKLQDGDGR